MECKAWTYEDFPDFTQEVEGAVRLPTTGDEIGIFYHHDVVYATVDGRALRLQILRPFTRNAPGRTWPCVVYVQGSAWRVQPLYKAVTMLAHLAERGYVVAVVEYRHSGIAKFPAQAQDAANAVRFLRLHAAEYNIQPQNLFLAGTSSGGHTALFAALWADREDASLYPGVSARVSGVLDYYGAVDLVTEDAYPSDPNHHGPESAEATEMGGDLRHNMALRRRGTFAEYLTPETDLPPVFLMHGTKDRTVNVRQSVALYRRLRACGKQAVLYLVEGADHGGAEYWTPAAIDAADAFLRPLCR